MPSWQLRHPCEPSNQETTNYCLAALRVLAITLRPGVSLLCSMPIAVGLEKGYPVEKRTRPARRVKGVRQPLRSASLPMALSGDLQSSPRVSRLRAA
jgi:hypothetical protein